MASKEAEMDKLINKHLDNLDDIKDVAKESVRKVKLDVDALIEHGDIYMDSYIELIFKNIGGHIKDAAIEGKRYAEDVIELNSRG